MHLSQGGNNEEYHKAFVQIHAEKFTGIESFQEKTENKPEDFEKKFSFYVL